MTFKRSHIDRRNRRNHPFCQKAVEVFLNSQGIPGANPFIDQKRLAVNLIRTSFMMPQYMKNGLLCQEEWQQGWYYHWLSLKFLRGRWCVEEAHTSTHPPAPYKKFTSVVNKKTRVIIP
jgi:hypothetical protein